MRLDCCAGSGQAEPRPGAPSTGSPDERLEYQVHFLSGDPWTAVEHLDGHRGRGAWSRFLEPADDVDDTARRAVADGVGQDVAKSLFQPNPVDSTTW